MNRAASLLVGIVLLAVGIALIVYRAQGGAALAEPLPVVVTVVAVAALLGGYATMRTALKGTKGLE